MATNDYAITNTLLQSLFGPSPEQQAQEYKKAREVQALNVANLGSEGAVLYAGSKLAQDLGQSAQQLGGAVRRGVFGIETPKEIEDNVANQIKAKAQPLLQQGDMAAYADFLAQEYSKAGLTDRALRAKTAGDQFRMKQAELAKVRSEETKNLAAAAQSNREGRTPLADRLVALDTKKATTGLTPAEEAEKEALERVVKLQSPKETKFDFGAAFGKEESKQQAQVQTDAYKALGGVAVAGARTLRDIGEVESIIDDTFKGGAANLQIGASKLAAAAGIQIPKTASNSEIVQALFGKLVIPLVKQFPGALAVKELEALQKTQPQLLNEPETIKRLIALAKQDILASREVFDRASKYKKENKDSLKGFDFDDETVSVYDLISEASRLTPDRAAELAKTEEGKERLRQLRKFMPKG